MDVSTFMGGSLLSAVDLAAGPVTWTIAEVTSQQVGTDLKVCVKFHQHPKPLGLNKVNLRTVAQAYTTSSEMWVGKPLELRKETTLFQGKTVPCVRVYVPAAPLQTVAQQAQAYVAPQQPAPAAPPQWQQQAPAPQAPIPGPVQPPAAPVGPVQG